MRYDKNGRQYDYGKGPLQYQDDKFRDKSKIAIQKQVRTTEPDEAYTSLKPSWCEIL